MGSKDAFEQTTAEACIEYYFSLSHNDCEVTKYLCVDKSAANWMSNHCFKRKMEVHHISGRPKPKERNYFCNLIRICDPAHDWIHDVNPVGGELACWVAKLKKHKKAMVNRGVGMSPSRNGEMRARFDDWHLPTLNAVVTPMVDYAGRVSYLTDKAKGTPFEKYGKEILDYIKKVGG